MKTDELLDVAVGAARAAGELLLEEWREPMSGVSAKSTPTDLVSDADRDAENLIIDHIRERRPEDGILSEEGGGEDSTSGLTWIIDPLDGTINYLFRIGVWAVSIAVHDSDGGVAGVVYDVTRDELFTAARDSGARLNGRPIHVSDRDELARALIGTGFAYNADARAEQAETLQRVLPRVRDIRRAGSAAIDLASVAAGRLDGFYEAPMQIWDKAAGILLVQEAGGVVSDLSAPLGLSPGVIAAGPPLHDQLRALVLDVPS